MKRSVRGRALRVLAVIGVMVPVGGSFPAPSSAITLVCALTHSCPLITGVSPNVGGPDLGAPPTVVITGSNLSRITTVLFGASPATSFHYMRTFGPSGRSWIVAAPPGGQPGSTVPVSGLAGTIPVPTKASYSYPLGVLGVSGPAPLCPSVDPNEDMHSGDWNVGSADHLLDFSGVGEPLTFVTSVPPVLNIATEFSDDSDVNPFQENPIQTNDCPRGQVIVGDGATFTVVLEACEVQATTSATTTVPQSPFPPLGACTDWNDLQGTWTVVSTVSDQLTDRKQLAPGQNGPGGEVEGDLAVPTAGVAALGLDNAAETLRVVAYEQETDSEVDNQQSGAQPPTPVLDRHARIVTPQFNVVASPIAVAQGSAVPYTIIYAPPGDQSTSTFNSTVGFGTDYTVENSTQQSDSQTFDQTVQDDFTAAITGKDVASALGIPDVSDALGSIGFKLTTSSSWDTNTKTSFGALDDLTDEDADSVAFGMTRPTQANWDDWPGDGTTCTTLAAPVDNSIYDCSPAGLQHASALEVYNHEAFWGDLFELEVHPQYAVYSTGSGTSQYVMLGADPGIGERNVLELYDCEEGVIVAGVSQCEFPYTSIGLVDDKGSELSYASTSEYEDLSPADARNLLELDPFFVAGSQDARILPSRGEPVGGLPYGAYASGAVIDRTGGSESPNAVTESYNNTQATKATAASTTTSGLDITDTYGATNSDGLTLPGESYTLTYGDKNSTETAVTLTFKDSTAVSDTVVTTSTATLSDVDSTTPGGMCPAPSPDGPSCHGPVKDESQVAIFLDRRFGSLMFVDPNAPPAPSSPVLGNERSALAQVTVGDAEGEAAQSSGFSDVPTHSAAGFAIGTLARLGVLSGYASKFLPGAPFTAAELATSLGRAVRLNPNRAIKMLGGQASKAGAALDESELAHAISVALGVTPRRADGYVDRAFARNRFSGSGLVTRADAAIALLPALTARCLSGCHFGS